MKSIVGVFVSLMALLTIDVAIAQEPKYWRVEAGHDLYLVERWGFQDNSKINIPIDFIASFKGGCYLTTLVPEFDNIKWITFAPLHSEDIFEIRLKDDRYCYNEGKVSWTVEWTGGKLSVNHGVGDLFEVALPALVVLPSTGEKTRVWIPRAWISLIQPISVDGARNLEKQWPPPDQPNSTRSPAEALKHRARDAESALIEYRRTLSFREPLTNCGRFMSQTNQDVKVSGRSQPIPISKIYPNGYPCEL